MQKLGKRLLGSFAIAGAALLLVGFAGGGCQSKLDTEHKALHKQHQDQLARNDELQKRVEEQERDLAAARRLAAQRQAQAATPPQPPPIAPAPPERDPLAARPSTPSGAEPPVAPPPPAGDEFGRFKGQEDRATGIVTITLPGDVVFDPGQATLKPAIKADLDKTAATLKGKHAGKTIRVEGHTDTDPIRKSKWRSNKELSEARAVAVRDYLVQKGVEASRVRTLGKGDTEPKGDKAASRRVEIRLLTASADAADGSSVRGGAAESDESLADTEDAGGGGGETAQPASDGVRRPDLNK